VEYGDRSVGITFVIGFPSKGTPTPAILGVMRAESAMDTDWTTDFFEAIGGSELSDHFYPQSTEVNGQSQSISILGRGGADIFEGADGRATVRELGGAGNDLFTGSGSNVAIYGQGGNDLIKLFFVGAPGFIDGGAGGDTIDLSERDVPNLDLHDFVSVENVIGIHAHGTLIGTASANYFAPPPGVGSSPLPSVTIIGDGGNDTLIGSAARDRLDGGDGNDVISGGGGNDTIYGGNGNDIINGNSGNDRLYGGAGNDTLIGGPGRDHLYGEAGNDFLNTKDNKIDTLYGGDGYDSANLDHKTVNDIYHDIEKLL
jgi:Ca2+-binding RTX toxin-like protein